MSRSLYLIDGFAQIYRAYFAPFGNLSSPTGEPTRATHVFCQMLINLVKTRRPTHIATALDTSDETVFRREFYPEYKAHRDPTPEDLIVQIDRIVEILGALGMSMIRVPRFEADDLMATIVEQLRGEDVDVYLVSRDKDLDQLLGPRVALYDPLKDEVTTPQRLLETKGWRPDQAIDAQTLIGDSTDNVPGVQGIGPKTAAKLLTQYGDLQNLLAHIDELSPRQRDNVRAFLPQLECTRALVTLRRDVPLSFTLDEAAVERLRWSECRPILSRLGFRRLLDQLPDGAATGSDDAPPPTVAANLDEPETSEAAPPESAGAQASSATTLIPLNPERQQALRALPPGRYELIQTIDALHAAAERFARATVLVVDTETTGLSPIDAELVGVALSDACGHGCYIPVRNAFTDPPPLSALQAALGPILANEACTKIGHHLKYDMLVLERAGMPVRGPLFDTMIAAFVLDPLANSYKLDSLVHRFLGHTMIPITDLIGRGRDALQMDQVPLAQVTEYAGEDAAFTLRLHALFEPALRGSDLESLFYETEMPLVRVLTDMEMAGIRLDVEHLAGMSRRLAARCAELEARIHELVGRPFNLDSPKQLAEVLFDQLGMRVVRRTRTARSTDAESLETLARETRHPALELLLEHREIQKLRGTYVDALPAARSRRTDRVHTSYHQTGAITGRLSSSEPNLQNIPIRTELGREIRRAFVPRSPTERLIVADYSQVELRVLAHFSQDEALLRAFQEDQDIHAFVAAQVNGVEPAAVTREMRSRAKAVNFGLIYGQTAFGLAQGTGMSRSEADAFIATYFRRYPRIRGFIDECIQHAHRTGYVRTILGRRRPIPNIGSANRTLRQQAERLAVNTVVQGSAADLIKLAMIHLRERIVRESLPLRMLLQVHDELVCECPADRAAELAEVVRDVMSSALPLRVPLRVDVAIAENWLDAK